MLKEVQYVIMDKKRNFIVRYTNSKDRKKYITLLNDNTKNIFFYNTEGHAKNGIISIYVGLEEMLEYYPEIKNDPKRPHQNDKLKYSDWFKSNLLAQLEIVKVEMSIKEI
jgi:ABC-type glycerol-3-phosphate transport system substrate-binding protein